MALDRLLLCLLWLYVTLQDVTGLSVVVSPSPTVQVVSGQTLSITCQWSVDYTGPNAAVNYRLNDSVGRIGTGYINFGTCTPFTTTPYILTCNKDTRTLGIQIPANSYSHGDRWMCEGRNDNFDGTTPPQTDMTTVDVRVPVTSVTITPSTTVTVDVGISTTLTCTTQPHSRPTASVTWYRVVSGQPQQITANISVSYDTQNSAQMTTSVLSYVPSKEDNGRSVYCVSDGGWTGSTDTTLESARVSLNVRYPPDTDPVVSGYDGSTKYTGDSVTLSCTVVGGNPAASLSLTCPDGTTSTSGTMTVTLSNTFHDRTCSCVVTHVVGGYSRTVATPTFIVNIPVTSVTITPSTTVTVDVGTSTILTCITQPHSRPTASVTWYRVVSGQPQQINANISVSHDTQNSAQTTTSVLSYVTSIEDNGRTVNCVSDGGWTGSTDTTLESARASLNVRYPPDTDPVVSGYDGSTKYTGDSVTLSCTVVGGNPAASLSLTCPDGTTSTSGTLTVTLSNTFHGGTCSCVVTHVVGSYSRTVATPTFIVNIPVTSLIITPSTILTVDVGTSTTLTCTTHPHSRPTASVTWYRVVSGQPQQITTNISVSHDTQNSAQITTSVLSYVPSKEDNRRAVYCTSDGGWTGTTITNLQSNAVTLNVRYRPYISIVPQVNPYVITEGQIGISLECNVTSANPPVTSIVWTKEATEVSNTGVYNLATITTGHSGEYTCSATNDVGTTAESISLVVISSPAEPNIVGITNVSSSSLTVKWSPNDESSAPSTFNVSHRCKRCEVADTTSIVRIPDKGVYSTTFNNLLPETLYYVNITAINQVGSSNPLEIIVSTSPEETCYSPLKVANSSSTALPVIGVILIFISLCVLGFSIFLYRKSRLPSRTIDKQEDTSKAVVFSSVLRSEKDIEQLATAENRSQYQELDPRDIQPPSLYDSPSTGDNDARAENESNNYESINADPERRHYEHIKGGSKDYVNT